VVSLRARPDVPDAVFAIGTDVRQWRDNDLPANTAVAGGSEEIMERLPVRYAAIVCTVVGGMFMSGAGAVAFATTGSDGNGGDGSNSAGGTQNDSAPGTQNTSTGSTVRGFHLPKLSGLPGFGNSPFNNDTVGPVAPPAMNLPQLLGPGSSSPNVANLLLLGPGTPGLAAAPVAPLTVPTPDPAGRALTVLDNRPPADPGKQSPTTSLLPLVPPRVPVGQSVTIKNPLPDQLPIDLNSPIVPQLLPPPLVVILMAVAERVPLTGLVITPLLNAKVPPFIADRVIPALLSDIVVPTSPGAVLPDGTVPHVASLANRAAVSQPAGGSLPPELGVMGMDVPQAPAPAPLTFEPRDWPRQSDHDFTALSDPVAFRAGYSDYLRNAGTAQITAVAVPGAAAILLFTLGGGFLGYRQARAGHVIRAEGMTRFLR
jgi:hypothetical protein